MTRTYGDPKTAVVPGLEKDAAGITSLRLRAVMRQFLQHAAQVLEKVAR